MARRRLSSSNTHQPTSSLASSVADIDGASTSRRASFEHGELSEAESVARSAGTSRRASPTSVGPTGQYLTPGNAEVSAYRTPIASQRRVFTGYNGIDAHPSTPDFHLDPFTTPKSGKQSPPPLTPSSSISRFGWLGSGSAFPNMSPSSGSVTPSRSSKRTDSVALSRAEGGAFLADVDGENYLDEQRQNGMHSSMAFGKPRLSFFDVFKAFITRRSVILLLVLAACSLLLFGSSDRRKDVMEKAGDAIEKGWGSAEAAWDKADSLWSHKNGKEEHDLAIPPGSMPHDVPDDEPHKINIPPMGKVNDKVTSGTKHEASILDSVRTAPKLHPDKLKTTRCEKASSDAKDANGVQRPLVQYAIMIDAGSTGSRVHVYKFNFCKPSPELENEVFEMRKGGLSSFKADAKGAADSLRPLLKTALDAVPESLRSCTPISVKATAGLRLLGADLSKNILDAVRSMLVRDYPFPIADGSNKRGIEIMEGRDEGVFAWITVNYLLGRIGSEEGKSGQNKVQTAAVMDLGGASTQIVFEPIYESPSQGMHPGEHVYELSNFGGRKYTLYQNSYLGYGLMEARKSINSLTYMTYSLSHPDKVRTGSAPAKLENGASQSQASDLRIPNPCFAEGMEKKVPVKLPGQKEEIEVTMTGSAGGYMACKRLVEVMMDKDAVCKSQPCSFAGVYQPSLMTAFANSPIVALSYFYDRLSPLGLKDTFSIDKLVSLAERVCVPPAQWVKEFGEVGQKDEKGVSAALRELQDRPESCLDLTFLATLLRLGYELDDERSVTVAKKLGGNELGWCLGAELQVLQDGLICKAR